MACHSEPVILVAGREISAFLESVNAEILRLLPIIMASRRGGIGMTQV
jgi:hypothetical protein